MKKKKRPKFEFFDPLGLQTDELIREIIYLEASAHNAGEVSYNSTWYDLQAGNNALCATAYVKNDLVGIAVFCVEGVIVKGQRLLVHTDYRRHGIGTRLLEIVMEWMRDNYCKKLSWVLREANLDGQLFMQACGVQLSKGRPVVPGYFKKTGEDGYHFMHEACAWKASDKKVGGMIPKGLFGDRFSKVRRPWS